MSWRDYVKKSRIALDLERSLKPTITFHDGGVSSNANTDVLNRIIHLDISQDPMKCALSYSYELVNLNNATKYNRIINQARIGHMTKVGFVKSIIKLEAEAAFFRCRVFRDFSVPDRDVPFRKSYLDIYDSCIDKGLEKDQIINKISLYMSENGLVRGRFSVKKYYADLYDSYVRDKQMPSFYAQPQHKKIVVSSDDSKNTPKMS